MSHTRALESPIEWDKPTTVPFNDPLKPPNMAIKYCRPAINMAPTRPGPDSKIADVSHLG